jgi:hypothetical protein
MTDGHGEGHTMISDSQLANRQRRCLGVKGNVEENTLQERDLKATAKVRILDK